MGPAHVFDTDVARYAVELADGSTIRVKPECATPVRGSSGGGQRLGGHDRGHQGQVTSIDHCGDRPSSCEAYWLVLQRGAASHRLDR